ILLIVPLLLGSTPWLVLVLGTLFLAFSFTQLLVSIATTASFSLLVMHWYDGLERSEAASKRRRQTDEKLSRRV
ncbi:hypothetical protein ACFL9T_22930, partial [Thermodesulfobacteriota bacterium]